MTDSNVFQLNSPAADVLGEVLKQGAQQLLAAAIEAEVAELLSQYSDIQINGKQAVVRNGHLPERSIQTGLGAIAVKVPKVRDCSGKGVKFNSQLIPPYLKRTKAMEEFIPWLYLKGISTGFNASVGSVGDSYDNALAETINGLYKAEVIHKNGPWKSMDEVERATLTWVEWFNNRRLLRPIGDLPPAEYEMLYYQKTESCKVA